MKTRNVLSCFDGISAGIVALQRAGIEFDNYYAFEIDKFAIKCSTENHPNIIQLGDINNWEDNIIEDVDLIIGGFACFVEDTLILTKQGYKEIKDIVIGDEVLSHTGDWRKVIKTNIRENVPTRVLKGYGCLNIETTDEHPFYTRGMYRKYHREGDFRTMKRLFSEPSWTEAKNIKPKETYLSFVKSVDNVTENNYNFWYMIGRYTGDGYYRKTKRKHRKNSYSYIFNICCGKHELKELKEIFDNSGY